ncbi:hypothetical protein LINGRAHAP2_LOCUS22625 [Linum grandiflorum]
MNLVKGCLHCWTPLMIRIWM